MNYTILIEKDEKSGWYTGQCQQLPEAISQGETLDELMENMKDAISLTVQSIKEDLISQRQGRKFFRRKLAVAV